MKEVHAAIGQIPLFSGVPLDRILVDQLGGQTNRNFKLTFGDDRYVLRLAGAGTEMIINRQNDETNSIRAAEIGVSTRVVYADRKTGIMLREYVEGITLTTDSFRDPAIIDRVANALLRVHSSGVTFESHFSILAKLDEYEAILRNSGGPLPIDYFDLARTTQPARDILASQVVKLAPCHNDLVAANFLDTGDRVLVLDWEYSGMNDPLFDLGALSAEVHLTADEEGLLLRSYFGGSVTAGAAHRLSMYRILWNQWVTTWSMVQIANWNVNDNFWQFGMAHFEEFRSAVEAPTFAAKVSALRL